MALGRPDRHAGGGRDFLERVAESVLEDDHLRLLVRDPRQRVAELSPELADPHAAGGIVLDVGAELVGQRIVAARALPLGHVAARVDHEPVQPRRKLRLAAELLETDAELRQRLLRGVARVLGIAQQTPPQPLDSRRVPDTKRFECLVVTGLRASHENRVAEARVVETALTQRLPDPPHGGTSLDASVGSLSGLRRALVARAPWTAVSLRRGVRVDPRPARPGRGRGDDGSDQPPDAGPRQAGAHVGDAARPGPPFLRSPPPAAADGALAGALARRGRR